MTRTPGGVQTHNTQRFKTTELQVWPEIKQMPELTNSTFSPSPEMTVRASQLADRGHPAVIRLVQRGMASHEEGDFAQCYPSEISVIDY